MSGGFQFPERLQAAIALRLAARVVESELLTQELGQIAAVDELASIQQLGNICNSSSLRQRPLDLVL